jgi:preprotein translocase subunit SecE
MAQTSAKAAKPHAGQRLMRYLSDVRAELRRVVWPTRAEIISSSWIVVITLAIFIVLIFSLDYVSSIVVRFLASVGG